MIDVPTRVKDALRDGRRLKRYRFVVPDLKDPDAPIWVTMTNYTDETQSSLKTRDYTALEPGTYKALIKGAEYGTFYFNYAYYISGVPVPATRGVELTVGVLQEIELPTGAECASVLFPAVDEFTLSKSDHESVVIDNDSLVKESVKFDERMVTGRELKFGLCEGTSLEFQYFNRPNINGYQIQAFIDVQYKDSDNTLKWYTIPMGWYTVDQCPMQFSTGIFKATAYNKLQSNYLDANANELVQKVLSDTVDSDKVTIASLQGMLLRDYAIESKETGVPASFTPVNSGMQQSTPTFKRIGSSTVYRPVIWVMIIQFHNLTANKRFRIYFEDYLNKLHMNRDQLREAILEKVQDDYWGDLWGSFLRSYFGALASFPNSKTGRYYLNAKLYPVTTADVYGNIEDLEYLYDARSINFFLPVAFSGVDANDNTYTVWTADALLSSADVAITVMDVDDIDTIEISKTNLPNVTLRDIVSANYELHCQYGKLDRTTDLFSGIELNQSFLYPADNLYPSDTLYPSGIAESSFKSQYSKLWTDMVGEQSFRNLIITYKGTIVDPDTQQTSEGDKTITKVVNASGTTDYIMDNNWLFKNLLWSDQDVEDYADAMVLKMQSIKWFPFEMWGAGLPYIESGDMIEISDREGNTYTTYILQRQLEGIQNLQDTYINGELDIF